MLTIGRIGSLRVKYHRPLPLGAKPKQVSVRCEPSGHWYASIQCEVQLPRREHIGPPIGIDVGVRQVVALSNGEIVNATKVLDQHLRRLRIQQRTLARRRPKPGQKASKGCDEARLALAKTYERVANARKDFNHKLSRTIAERFGKVVVEQLDIAKMVQNEEASARNILDVAWGQLLQFIEYKCEETGAEFSRVDPRMTSKTCSNCNTVPHSRPRNLTVRKWKCSNCGHNHDRDVNAAKNILKKGSKIA